MPIGLGAELPIPETGLASDLPNPAEGQPSAEQQDIDAFALTAGETRKGFRSGLNQVGGMLSNLAGQTGVNLGLEEFAEDRFKDAEHYTQFADAVGPRVKDIRTVTNFRDLTDWIAGTLGNAAATSAPFAATGLVGGALGGPVGAGAGLFAGATALEAGEQVGTLRADPKVMETATDGEILANAAGKGVVGGALELVGGAPGRVIRSIAKQGLRSTVKQAAKGALKTTAGEALTESGQELTGQVAHQQLNPDVEINPGDIAAAGAAGAVGGAGIGGLHAAAQTAGGALEGSAPDLSPAKLRTLLNPDRAPRGEADLPSNIDQLDNEEDIVKALEASDADTDAILSEEIKKPENSMFSDFKRSKAVREAFISDLKFQFNKRNRVPDIDTVNKAADDLKEKGAKLSEERTPMDESVHEVMMQSMPEDIAKAAPSEKLLELSQSVRIMLQEPASFRKSATVSALKRVLGDKYQGFLEDSIDAVYSSPEAQRQTREAIKAATGENEAIGRVHEKRIAGIVRNNLVPKYAADPTLKAAIDDTLIPQLIRYVEGGISLQEGLGIREASGFEAERSPQLDFLTAMVEAFGEKADAVLDQLDALRQTPRAGILEAQEKAPLPFDDDPRLHKRFPSRFEAEAALEGLRSDFDRNIAHFSVAPFGQDPRSQKFVIKAEGPDSFTLDAGEFAEVREPEKFGDTLPEEGIFTIKRTKGLSNKMNAFRLTRLMMRKDRQQTREGGTVKYVSDMFSRGISALFSMPEFKDVKIPRKEDGSFDFPDNLLVAEIAGNRITWGMVKEADFPQGATATRLRADIHAAETPEERTKALAALSKYYSKEQLVKDQVEPLVEGALEDLANNGPEFVDEAIVPLQEMQTRWKGPETHTVNGKRVTTAGSSGWRQFQRGIEFVQNQASHQAERAVTEEEEQDIGTTLRPQETPGARIVEEDTGLKVGKGGAARGPQKARKLSPREVIEKKVGKVDRAVDALLAEAEPKVAKPEVTPAEKPTRKAKDGEEIGLLTKREEAGKGRFTKEGLFTQEGIREAIREAEKKPKLNEQEKRDPDSAVEPYEPSDAEFAESLRQAKELSGGFESLDFGTENIKPETEALIRNYVKRVLGNKNTRVLFEKMKSSGQFIESPAGETLKIAIDSIDPMSKAAHEAMHAFMARLIKANPRARRILMNAASSPVVIAELKRLLKDHPKALKQLEDPEERVTYMYQFWSQGAEGLLPVGPETKTQFQKIKNWFRKATSWLTDNENATVAYRASDLLEAFHTGKYADRNEMADIMAKPDLAGAEERINKILPGVGTIGARFFLTASTVVRNIGNEHLTGVMDTFFIESGAERKNPGFLQAKHTTYNRHINKLMGIMEGMTKAQEAAILAELQGVGSAPEGGAASEGVKKIRNLLGDAWKMMRTAGVGTRILEAKGEPHWGPDGKPRDGVEGRPAFTQQGEAWYQPVGKLENYFPREFDPEYMRGHRQEFLALLEKHNIENPEAVFNNIVADINGAPKAARDETLGLTIFVPNINERTMGNIPDGELAPFMSDNLTGILAQYLARASRRSEYTQRFGNAGEEITKARKLAEADGVSAENLKAFDKAVQAMEGTLGAEMSPKWRAVSGALITFQNYLLLPLALFASFIDPLGIMIRGGTIGQASKAFGRGLKELIAQTKDEKYNVSLVMGSISAAHDDLAVRDMYNTQFMPELLRKANNILFKVNGMERWNTSMRISATSAAMVFIQKHAFDQNKHSERFLRELNLTKQDVKNDAEGNLVLSEKVKAAVNLWVDQAILRPNAAQRPIWFSDPRYGIISHLKQFMSLYWNNIMVRVINEGILHGNVKPALTLGLAYIPVMIAADMARAMVTPADGDDHEDWGTGDWLWKGVQRAGFFGPGQMVLDSGREQKFGGTGVGPFAGPTIEHLMDVATGNASLKRSVPIAKYL